jgi:hypothetical protein
VGSIQHDIELLLSRHPTATEVQLGVWKIVPGINRLGTSVTMYQNNLTFLEKEN